MTAASLIARIDALRREDPEKAWRALIDAFPGAARGADAAGRGALWRLRGHVLRGLQRPRGAAVAYRRAERWYARAGDVREQGRCAIGLVDALMYLGAYHEAARVARRGERLLRRAGDRAALARLLNNQGNLFHRLDLPGRALERYRAARRALARAGDARGAAMVDGNVANCLSLLGRLGEARRLYRGARRVHAAKGFALDALVGDYNLAYLDFLEHRHEPAMEGLARVRDEARGRGFPSVAALAALDRAEILLRMGAHDEALAEARRAREDCGAIDMAYERAKAETFAALAEFRLGHARAARERLERTLAAFHAEGNAVWTGEALVGLATVWWREGNPRAAAALLEAARRRFTVAADREREACATALVARCRLAAGDRAGARSSLRALRRVAHPSPRLRHLVLAARAAEARARGDDARARGWLQRAALEAERLAARILDEHWRASFWGEWGWPHRELAALELEQRRPAAAFDALERGRGRALAGRAAHARRARGGALPGRARAWAATRLAHERHRGAVPGVAAPRPTTPATERIARWLRAIPPRAIRAEAVARALPERALLVDYLLHERRLDAIAMRRDRCNGHCGLAGEAWLNGLVHALLFELRSAAFASPGARGERAALDEGLAAIAAAVLWPVLEGGPMPDSLALLPVGPLARLPWAALPLPDGRALCEAASVVVVPGLRVGVAAERAAFRVLGRPLVVAADAGELAQVEAETRAILKVYPDAVVLAGADATAERFLTIAPVAGWIHFAGHGYYRADAPHESGLQLADRWLLAGELADLRLSARWVTLSACQSARALVQPGEEWFGLARTFLLTGAGAVLASNWDIADGAASSLMESVYMHLGGGAPLARALARAQSEKRAAGLHPLDWAGFTVLGGPGTLFDAQNRPVPSGRLV